MEVKDICVQELWEKFATDRSRELRNVLLEKHLYLVKKLVHLIMPTYTGYADYDDLYSFGVMGLISAIERFDLTRAVQFETYASLRIRGEIIDHLRKQDWAPSSVRSKIKQINNASSDLEIKLGRQPTECEIAQFIDMDVKKIRKIMNNNHTFNMLYLDDFLSESNSRDIDSECPGVGEGIEQEELRDTLALVIDQLSEKEKLIITLYYYEEMSFKEIAMTLEVSESRVSQIHSKTIGTLRNKLKSVDIL